MIFLKIMLTVVCAKLAFLVVSMAAGTPVNFTQGTFSTTEQSFIENNALLTQLKHLEAENIRITSIMRRVLEENVKCERSRQVLEHTLNNTMNNLNVAGKADCETGRKVFITKLDRCEEERRILLNSQLIHHHVLNASKTAHQECSKDTETLRALLHTCRKSTAAFPRTCQEWSNLGYAQNGDYVIDPDGPEGVATFHVDCDMDAQPMPVTVIHHDSEGRISAGQYDDPYSNVRYVTYQASIAQIAALINVSTQCGQFIKYECFHSHMTNFSTWYSRDGVPMDYWGGAAPGSNKCACGMTHSCDVPDTVCNCDANDAVWRSDAGTLTDKDTLPVTKMAFGDLSYLLEIDEKGYHKLGPLRCY